MLLLLIRAEVYILPNRNKDKNPIVDKGENF